MRKHLEKHNMTYFEHLGFAWSYAFTLMFAAFAAVIHGLLPWFFETTASDTVKTLESKK